MAMLAAAGARADTRELEQRGAYLVQITGCTGCHSPRNAEGEIIADKRLTGGDRALPAGDIGRFYPPNITADEETGIGDWSAEDIVKALKSGETPLGRILLSAMPWRTQYKDLTQDDALAIATYLKSLAPVRHRTPAPLAPLKASAPQP
jgi:mono/diheme cytochrome c family protein